jgi:glyoxylase-like metal-dependent hydrolase (beta-lactamase superfamily II)
MSDDLVWHVGDVTITRIEEGISYLDATALIPDFTPDVLEPHSDWLRPHFFSDRNDKMALSIHAFVVESQGKTIVVDTCVGEGEHSLPSDPEFPTRLAEAIDGGLDAVDVVLCTHLHFDHVGWNLRDVDGERVPTFPNARYLFAETEVAHTRLEDHHGVIEPSVQPLIDAGLADLVAEDHAVTDEVRLISTPGHTPGHVSVAIESNGERAVITGDMAHTPLQFAEPDLSSANFDHDAAAASKTRHQMLGEWTDEPVLILGTHFAPPTAGHIVTAADRVVFRT